MIILTKFYFRLKIPCGYLLKRFILLKEYIEDESEEVYLSLAT